MAEISEHVFRVLNIIIGALIVVAAVLMFWQSFTGFIVGVFNIIFGLLVIAMEFFVPDMVSQNAQFLFTFAGRGLSYL
jgi:hypothetical protein